MSERVNQELNIAVGLLGLEFVFLTLMMDIPKEDILFNQTLTFTMPFYYSLSLPDFIQSCIWISSFLIIVAIIFYLSLHNIKNDPYNIKKEKHKMLVVVFCILALTTGCCYSSQL